MVLSEEGYTQRVIAARAGCTQASSEKKTSRGEDQIVVRKSMADRLKTAPPIKAEMQIDYSVEISVSTIRRRLVGLDACRPRKKPRLERKSVQPSVRQ